MAIDVVLGVNLADAEAFIAANPDWADAEPWSPAAIHRVHKWHPLGRVTTTPAVDSYPHNRYRFDRLYGVAVRWAEQARKHPERFENPRLNVRATTLVRRCPDGVDAF